VDFITPSHHYFSRPKCFLSSNNNNEECTSQSFTSCVEFKQDLLLDWVCLKCIKIQFIKVNGKRAVTMDIFSIFKRRTAIRKWQFNTKFPQAIFVECPLMEFVLRRIKIHLCICNIWVVSVYKIVLNLLINKRRHRLSKYSNRIQMSTKIVICFPNNIETNLPPYIAVYSFVELLVQQSCSHICKLPTSTAVLQKNRNIGPIYRKNKNGQTVIIPVRPSCWRPPLGLSPCRRRWARGHSWCAQRADAVAGGAASWPRPACCVAARGRPSRDRRWRCPCPQVRGETSLQEWLLVPC
jgi:hypothetical protein